MDCSLYLSGYRSLAPICFLPPAQPCPPPPCRRPPPPYRRSIPPVSAQRQHSSALRERGRTRPGRARTGRHPVAERHGAPCPQRVRHTQMQGPAMFAFPTGICIAVFAFARWWATYPRGLPRSRRRSWTRSGRFPCSRRGAGPPAALCPTRTTPHRPPCRPRERPPAPPTTSINHGSETTLLSRDCVGACLHGRARGHGQPQQVARRRPRRQPHTHRPPRPLSPRRQRRCRLRLHHPCRDALRLGIIQLLQLHLDLRLRRQLGHRQRDVLPRRLAPAVAPAQHRPRPEHVLHAAAALAVGHQRLEAVALRPGEQAVVGVRVGPLDVRRRHACTHQTRLYQYTSPAWHTLRAVAGRVRSHARLVGRRSADGP